MLPLLDTIGTGDPNSIHQAQTHEVLIREQHGICFRKDNLINTLAVSNPMLKRVIRSSVQRKRGTGFAGACSASILVSQ